MSKKNKNLEHKYEKFLQNYWNLYELKSEKFEDLLDHNYNAYRYNDKESFLENYKILKEDYTNSLKFIKLKKDLMQDVLYIDNFINKLSTSKKNKNLQRKLYPLLTRRFFSRDYTLVLDDLKDILAISIRIRRFSIKQKSNKKTEQDSKPYFISKHASLVLPLKECLYKKDIFKKYVMFNIYSQILKASIKKKGLIISHLNNLFKEVQNTRYSRYNILPIKF